MFLAFKTHASNPSKPDGMPDAWPWGEVIPRETQTAPDESEGWLVYTSEQFLAYKILHRDAYQTYIDGVNAQEQADKEMLDQNQRKIDAGKLIMLKFKEMNISDGINPVQAIWLHSKTRKLQIQIPVEAFGIAMGTEIDILNMALAGDLEAGCIALQFAVADDMSQPYHWLNQERINWLVNELKSYLGWA